MSRKRVLVTGAGGRIGTIVRRRLADRYELRLLTHQPIDEPSHVADLADLDAIRPAFDGVDAVLHLAAVPRVDAAWEEILPANIVGTRNVFEAARLSGTRQVVFASSTHVSGMYEREAAPAIYDVDDRRMFDEGSPPRPDSLYGVAKGFGELIGRYYADRHGLSVICLRIGSVVEDKDEQVLRSRAGAGPSVTAGGAGHSRMRAIWLSHRDCAQLIDRALAADHVRWAVVYGTSDNERQLWDLRSARRILGYRPHDGLHRG